VNTQAPRLPLSPIKSSHLAAVGYDPATNTLDVKFANGGKTYRYHGVPPHLHHDLMSAKSHGNFFFSAIRGRFRHSELT
jgi:hypothetical protein